MPSESKGNVLTTSATPALTSDTMRVAIRFFRDHAGYVVGRRLQGAARLARAEALARENGLWFGWEEDHDDWRDRQTYEEETGNTVERSEGCVCYGPEHDGAHYPVLASLWSIWDASPEDRRVVEAELALEALAELGVSVK